MSVYWRPFAIFYILRKNKLNKKGDEGRRNSQRVTTAALHSSRRVVAGETACSRRGNGRLRPIHNRHSHRPRKPASSQICMFHDWTGQRIDFGCARSTSTMDRRFATFPAFLVSLSSKSTLPGDGKRPWNFSLDKADLRLFLFPGSAKEHQNPRTCCLDSFEFIVKIQLPPDYQSDSHAVIFLTWFSSRSMTLSVLPAPLHGYAIIIAIRLKSGKIRVSMQ